MTHSVHRFNRPNRFGIRARWLLGALALSSLFASAASAVTKPKKANAEYFPEPASIEARVRFWERIFRDYPTTTMLVHDVDQPEKIVDMLDFKAFAKQSNFPGFPSHETRDRVAQNYIKRYELGLSRFHKLGRKAVEFGAIEKRLFDVYGSDPISLSNLVNGRVRLRAQTGLSDEFRKAIERAEKYLPHMEKIFTANHLPAELTRIAFVESMFNDKARSKVGASGVWQFMPKTARKYLYLNHFIDERNSPLKSTQGAAKLLAYNFEEIRSWPLAITAYNHGLGGMKQAITRTHSRDIGRIISNYESPSFGFASKNFYAEFLAADRVYSDIKKRAGGLIEPADLVPVTINKRLSIAELLRNTPIDKKTLEENNRCLLPGAFSTYSQAKLPPYFQIYLPRNVASKVQNAINKINAPKYAARSS